MLRQVTLGAPQNPSEAALRLIQSEYPKYHPLIALAHLAHRKEVTDDPRLELEVHRTILPFVTPKLSNIEVRPEIDSRRRVVISLFSEDLVDDVEAKPIPTQVPLLVDEDELVPLDAE